GLANIPTDAEVARLTDLVTKVLQPVRDILGKPIKINSGFRSLAVNNEVLRMKKVNGKSTYVAM
ncbi:MAG TPA: D-Ala-D-Ala carboxypeptidase family metallohydrolase, partial [Prolixibacteraceae bacterium]|nr:D-Ala-D-Ala carboxypeptidase family metallohydrolase [Prolixibacteraceae bacterium]